MTSSATCLPRLHRERLDATHATDDEAIHRRCVDHEDSYETATTRVQMRVCEGDGPRLQACALGWLGWRRMDGEMEKAGRWTSGERLIDDEDMDAWHGMDGGVRWREEIRDVARREMD